MNRRELFDSRWQQIRTHSNGWWSLIADYDLDKVEKYPVMRDKYVMILQVKYGYTRDQAREEIDRRVAALPEPPAGESGQAAAAQKARSSAKPRTSRAKKPTAIG